MSNSLDEAFTKLKQLSCDYKSDWNDDLGADLSNKIVDICNRSFENCRVSMSKLQVYSSIDIKQEKEKLEETLKELTSIVL